MWCNFEIGSLIMRDNKGYLILWYYFEVTFLLNIHLQEHYNCTNKQYSYIVNHNRCVYKDIKLLLVYPY